MDDVIIVQHTETCRDLLRKIHAGNYRATVVAATDPAAKRMIAQHGIKMLPAMVRNRSQVSIGAGAILKMLAVVPQQSIHSQRRGPVAIAPRTFAGYAQCELRNEDSVADDAIDSSSINDRIAKINEKRRAAAPVNAATRGTAAPAPIQRSKFLPEPEPETIPDSECIESTADLPINTAISADMDPLDQRILGAMMQNLGPSDL